MSEATATQTAPATGAQATGTAADEANRGDAAKGTAAAGATVQAGDAMAVQSEEQQAGGEGAAGESAGAGEGGEGVAAGSEPVLRYSDDHLTAAKAEAEDAGYRKGRVEYDGQIKERRKQLTQAYAGTEAELAPALRQLRNELDLDEDSANRVIGRVQQAFGAATDIALAVAAETYAEAINALFETTEERKAFWERAEGVDPGLSATEVIKLAAEHLALGTDAIKQAKPEDLLKANKGLAAHVAALGDAKYESGREQGRKDPRGEHSTEAITGAAGSLSYAAYMAMSSEDRAKQDEGAVRAMWAQRSEEMRRGGQG